MKIIRILFLSIILALITTSSVFAQKATLVLFPHKLDLSEKDRRAEITIVNKGDARGLYRVGLVDTEMTEKGTLMHLDEDVVRDHSLKPIIRLSPRRMLLNPGQSQRIRILIKKPKDLYDGEYRSHLKVKLLEDNVDEKGRPIERLNQSGENLALLLKARYVTSIPIFLRVGNLSDPSVTLSDAAFLHKDDRPVVDFTINRAGDTTIRGDIKITYIDTSGTPTVVKYFPSLPVYNPTNKIKVSYPLDVPDGVNINKGTIHITYSKAEDKGGALIAETKLSL